MSCYIDNDWHPVCFETALAPGRPLGVRLLERDVVVWRETGAQAGVPAAPALHAWPDRCPHRGTRLSLGRVVDNRLQCPYHGWQFDRDGGCAHVPAQPGLRPQRARLPRYSVQIAYGLVWVCLGERPNPLPPFPEWQRGEFRKIPCGPYPVATSGPRIVENFLDVAHFPFVHGDVLGVAGHAEIDDYPVAVGEAGVEASDVRVYQPDPYGTGRGDTVAYTYRACRPLTAYLLKQSDGPRFSILLTITPHTPVSSSAFMWMAMNYGHDLPADELIAWQDGIFLQDRPVLESQRPQRLPLDPAAEVSVRCDRTAVAYRRWLKALGVTFGTT